MSKIDNFNSLKNKLKKLATVVVFCLLAVASQVKTYPHIPLKGLFEVLKKDDIGFAHALLHSKWIENVYQYGQGKPPCQERHWRPLFKNDPVVNLIRKFWFRRSENHQLLPTQFGPFVNIPNDQLGEFFGQLINYVYLGSQKNDQEQLISKLLVYDEQFKQELTALLRELDEQEYKLEDKKFVVLKQTKSLEQEKIKELQKKYKMGELKDEIARESKEWGKKKGFAKKRKEIEGRYDQVGCRKALAAEKKKIFEQVSQEIQDEYREILSSVRKMRVNIDKKINKKRDAIKRELFEPIQKAFVFCQTSKIYAPRTIEAILWALFFHKLESAISFEEKIKAINNCIKEIDDVFINKRVVLKDLYKGERFEKLDKELKKLRVHKQVHKLFENYDLALHYIISLEVGKIFPPVIGQGSYGYEYEPGKISDDQANCYETAILDAFSILWYNPVTKTFDDSLFADHIIKNGEGFKRLREALKYFYLAEVKKIRASEYTCKYKGETFTSLAKLKSLGKISVQEVQKLDISEVPVFYITRPEIKQEFFNIVSGIPGVIYCSKAIDNGEKNFELECDVRNIIAVWNYFYGTRVKTIEELSDIKKGISTDTRSICFEKQDDKANTRNIITISVGSDHGCFSMDIHINPGHTFLSIFARQETASHILIVNDILEKIVEGSSLGLASEQKMQFFLGSDHKEEMKIGKEEAAEKLVSLFTLLSSKDLLKNMYYKAWSLPMLGVFYFSLALETPEEKLDVIRKILYWDSHVYENYKELVYNLVDAFPRNDQYLKYQLSEIILKSKFYNQEFFKSFIEKEIVGDPAFYGYPHGIKEILKLAIEMGNLDLALKMVNNPEFKTGQYDIKEVLVLALQKPEFVKVATKVLQDSTFKDWVQVVTFALTPRHDYEKLSQERKDAVLKILQHPCFTANIEDLLSIFKLGIKHKATKVLLEVIKKPEFDTSKYKFQEFFQKTFRKRLYSVVSKDVILEFVKHSTFKPNVDELKLGLKYALLYKHKEIALAIVNNPAFEAPGKEFGELLVYALKLPEYSAIAAKILQDDSKFNRWQEAVMFALKQRWEDTALMLLRHPQLNVKALSIGKIITSAMAEYCEAVAFELVKNEKLCARGACDGRVLALALEKEEKMVAQEIVKSENFSVQNAGKALVLGLSNPEYAGISEKILQNPEFNDWQAAIKFALTQGYKDIAVKLVNHEKFSVNGTGFGEIVVLLFNILRPFENSGGTSQEERYRVAAEKVLQDPKFDDWQASVNFAFNQGHKKEALKILEHEKCNAIYENVKEVYKLALEHGSNKVALRIAKEVTFDTCYVRSDDNKRLSMIEAFDFAVKYKNPDVALEVIKRSDFSATKYSFGKILDLSLERGYKNVVLEFVKHPTFNTKACDAERVLVSVLHNPEYQEIAEQMLQGHPLTIGWAKVVGYALEKGYESIALELIENPSSSFQGSSGSSLLKKALEKKWEKVILAIIGKPGFKYSEVGEALVLLLSNPEYVEIGEKILQDSAFKSWETVLKFALKNKYEREALKIVTHSRFKASFWGVNEVLLLALNKKCQDVALAIVSNAEFNGSGWKIREALVVALKKGHEQIASKIMDASKFSYWGGALEFAIKNGDRKAALTIMEHEKFEAHFKNVKGSLQAALKQGWGQIALTIVKNKKFEEYFKKEYEENRNYSINSFLSKVLREALKQKLSQVLFAIVTNKAFEGYLKKERTSCCYNRSCPLIAYIFRGALEYKHINLALAIVNNPEFISCIKGNCWECSIVANILRFALENDCESIVRTIVKNPKFEANYKGFGKVLVLCLKHEKYKDIALEILEDPSFNDSEEAVKFAIKCGYKKIALLILKSEKCKAGCSSFIKPLICALEKEDEQMALAIVKSKKFNIDRLFFDIKALTLALERGYKEVAVTIMDNSTFSFKDSQLGEVLVLALSHKNYADIAARILEHPEFNGWDTAITYALEQKREDIALALVHNEKFEAMYPDVGSVIESALEKGHENVALAIMDKCEFVSSDEDESDSDDEYDDHKIKKSAVILLLALKYERYAHIAQKILQAPDPYCCLWKKAIKLVLKRGGQDIALKMVRHSTFRSQRRRMGEILKWLLEHGHEIVFLEAMKNSGFKADFKGVLSIFKMLLEPLEARGRPDIDLALKIIGHSTFDAKKRWVSKIEEYAREFIEKNLNNQERQKELQKVIDEICKKRNRKKIII